MDPVRVHDFRDKLEDIAVRLHGDVLTISEQAHGSVGGQGAGEITNSPQHLGDLGTDEYLYGINATLLENEEYLSKEVREAFSRLEDHTFGICEACGQAIAEERLEAIPYTRYCAVCAERLEPIFAANYNPARAESSAGAEMHHRGARRFVPPHPDDSPFVDEDDQDSEFILSDDVRLVDGEDETQEFYTDDDADFDDGRPAKPDMEDFVP